MITKKEQIKKYKVELTRQEIDSILTELQNANHILYMFLNYEKIVIKLKKVLK